MYLTNKENISRPPTPDQTYTSEKTQFLYRLKVFFRTTYVVRKNTFKYVRLFRGKWSKK